MLDSVSSIAAFATQISTQKTAQQVEIAVLKKAQDIQEEQGKAVLQLLESASVPAQSIDVYAWTDYPSDLFATKKQMTLVNATTALPHRYAKLRQ